MGDTQTASSATPVPVFDPQGVLRDVPPDQLPAAVKAGGQPAVKFQAPDGTQRFVPATRYREAFAQGGKILPLSEQPVKHPGFWSTLTDDLTSMVKGSAKTALHLAESASGTDIMPLANDIGDSASAIHQNWKDRTAKGEGLPYKVGAAANEMLGVNVAGEEKSAAEGDVGGVLGHASAVPAAMAVTAGAARLTPKLAAALEEAPSAAAERLRNITPKQAAQVAGGATGAVAGHGTLSVPGAYYGAKGAGNLAESILGKERANAPIIPDKPAVYPGASLPATPPTEVLQASSLARGPQAAPEPAAGLGKIPARAELPAAFQPRTPKAPPVSGTVDAPFQEPKIPARAEAPAVEPTPTPEPVSKTPDGNTIPRTLSGESALRQVLTGQDNANLLKIAKSRGINVMQESQLKPGVADTRIITKIIDDFSDEELSNVRDTYLENTRMGKHNFGEIGPEAWKTMGMKTYFPDVKIPATVEARVRTAISKAQPEAPKSEPVSDLTAILQESVKQAQAQRAGQ